MHSVFGHKEWKISVEWKNFSTEDLQNLLFMLEGCNKIKDDEMDKTNMCAGSDEEYEIKLRNWNMNF